MRANKTLSGKNILIKCFPYYSDIPKENNSYLHNEMLRQILQKPRAES